MHLNPGIKINWSLDKEVQMARLNIKIKDNEKADIVLQLLRELPFVEIEGDINKQAGKSTGKRKGKIEDLFGIWENRNISLSNLREKAWNRN